MDIGRWHPNEVPDWFWDLVEKAEGDRQKLKSLLMSVERRSLVDFHIWLNRLMADLMGPPYMDPEQSEDSWADLARWAVAQGRATYLDLWNRPEKMPKERPDKSGNGFGSVPLQVYRERFGEELED